MKLKQFLFITLFLILGSFNGWASQTDVTFIVSLYNGEKYGYISTDDPIVTYDSEKIYINSEVAEASYLITDVERLYFENSTTGINSPQTTTDISFDFTTKDVITVSGNIAGSTIAVYDIHGQQIKAIKPTSNITHLELGELSMGVYIINVNGKSIKFKKS